MTTEDWIGLIWTRGLLLWYCIQNAFKKVHSVKLLLLCFRAESHAGFKRHECEQTRTVFIFGWNIPLMLLYIIMWKFTFTDRWSESQGSECMSVGQPKGEPQTLQILVRAMTARTLTWGINIFTGIREKSHLTDLQQLTISFGKILKQATVRMH